MSNKTLLALIAIIIVLFVAFVLFARPASTSENDGPVTAATWQNIKGNPNAPVQIVEYADFQCPACASMHAYLQPILEQNPEKVALTFKHFPLVTIHAQARIAAQAAEAAGRQGKFFEMHDKIFETQSVWSRNGKAKDTFISYAEELGLDVEQFKKDIDSAEVVNKVRADMEEGKKARITGTPTIFINGEQVDNRNVQATLESLLKN